MIGIVLVWRALVLHCQLIETSRFLKIQRNRYQSHQLQGALQGRVACTLVPFIAE